MSDYFKSKDFDASKALENESLEVEGGKVYEDLNALRQSAHENKLLVPITAAETVCGPSGIPLPKVTQRLPAQGRFFHQGQGQANEETTEIVKKSDKEGKNVLIRMERMQGPLATLRRCAENNTKIKVYTRDHRGVRGFLTGYVVAFDKYWNLVLKQVQEVFIRKKKYKTVSLGNVDNYVSVADLTIQCDEDEPACPASFVWTNPFRTGPSKAVAASQPPEKNPPNEASQSKYRDSGITSNCPQGTLITTIAQCNPQELTETCRKIHDCEHLNSISHARLTGYRIPKIRPTRLKTANQPESPLPDKPQTGREKRKDAERESSTPGDSSEPDKSGSGAGSGAGHAAKKKRNRKRRTNKYEMRTRHVEQLLIRGETVVLINVLNDENKPLTNI